jgi:hypothetical protein
MSTISVELVQKEQNYANQKTLAATLAGGIH